MSNYLALAIGIDDYKEIIDTNKMYVDKTLLIKEFWEDGSSVILATRPRRFGKTLNLSMLKYFFEKTDQNTSYLFEKMKIWNHSEYQSLQAQFPVIFVTFKDVKFDSWESAYEKFASIIAAECKRLLHCLSIEKISIYDVAIFNRIINEQAPEHELAGSLQFLTQLLCEQTGKKVIVLIDEYDAPITHAYLKGYYSKMVGFVGNLLSTVLKSNVALGRGFLTGIMRTAKEGIFSGLNNLVVNTVLDGQYSNFFGFTQDEVDQLLMHYDLEEKKEEIKQWYDGYAFGKTHVYNPWSLLNCIKNRGVFDTYWANTSNNDLIKDIIARSNKEVKDDLELLLQGHIISEKQIDKGIIYPDLDDDEQEPWSFLLFTGYLTATAHTIINSRYFYALAIPNKEIELLYQDLVLKVLNSTISFSKLKKLVEALVAGNKKLVEEYLQEFVANCCSFYDVSENDLERSIHMFVLGLLAGISDRYIIQSNRESGDGRYDIMLMPRCSEDLGVLIEFKKAKKSSRALLESSAQEALRQIKLLDYKSQMRTFGYQGAIVCYGIATYGKHLVVVMEKM